MDSSRIFNLRWLLLWLLATLTLPGCEVVKGIFKAGIWTGVIGVALVLGLALWAMTKLRRS